VRRVPPGSAATLTRAGILAVGALTLSWPLATPLGVLAASLGAAAGVLVGERFARSRIRTTAALLLGALTVLVGWGGSDLLLRTATAPRLIGPVLTLNAAHGVLWLTLAMAATGALRLLSLRNPALSALEVIMLALSLAGGVSAHRHGMLHRPLGLSTWAWSRGIDPSVVLLVGGGLASLALAALLVTEERARRLLLCLLGMALPLVVRLTGLPMPRVSGGLGLTGAPAAGQQPAEGVGPTARSGGDLEFQNDYSSTGAEAPVAVVVFAADYDPPAGTYYFRESVFSQFNGRRLVRATRDDVDRDVSQSFPTTRVDLADVPAVSARRRDLEMSIGLLADHVRPLALDAPISLWPSQNPDPLRFRVAYGVRSRVLTSSYGDLFRGGGRPEWTREQWAHYTDGPTDPRYAELARTVSETLKPEYRADALAQALAVEYWLDKNAIYSRSSQHAGDDDPTGSFLFGNRVGYCVHLAHAAAFLLRSRGVPVRVAAGYAVQARRRGTGSSLMIRGADAHVWPEAYVAGVGWVVIDPAPEQSLDPPGTEPDLELQRQLGEALRQEVENPNPPAEEKANGGRIQSWFRGWLPVFGLLLCALGFGIKLYRAIIPSLAGPRQRCRVGYRAAMDRLGEVGWTRDAGESRERFAARVAQVAPSFPALTRAHLAAALGSTASEPPPGVRALVKAVRRELKLHVPWWARARGMANPMSWRKSR
jgi:protein-glutamine gamma-glutamyltransferase